MTASLLAILLLCQQPRVRPHRSGLWGEFGFGPGRVRVACAGCTDVVSASGQTSYLRIGGTVSDHVLVGFEAFSLLDRPFPFSLADSATTAQTATATVVILWFPGRHGLFLKSGVGVAGGRYVIRTSPTQTDTSSGAGIGLTFGAGWDWSISRKFAVTANLGAYVTALGDIVLPGRRVDDVIATMYQGAIGFSFR
ncbi:MAG: hypothetical protein ABR537_00960 [Gemmatimonadales bacterium]